MPLSTAPVVMGHLNERASVDAIRADRCDPGVMARVAQLRPKLTSSVVSRDTLLSSLIHLWGILICHA